MNFKKHVLIFNWDKFRGIGFLLRGAFVGCGKRLVETGQSAVDRYSRLNVM